MIGPCEPWTTEAQIEECCTGLAAGYDWTDAIAVASEVLHVLSGRQFTGTCTRTIRPCLVDCGCACHGAGWPLWGAGPPWSWYPRALTARCCPPQIDLHGGVASITSVKVDGETLAVGAYRLDEGRWLVRLADSDGDNEGWPCCQRLDLATTEECTFEIVYVTEADVPEMGARAAAELACELAKACTPAAGECRLPKRVTNLIRQGVSMTLLDPQDFLDRGRTGLYFPDLFLAAVNPEGLRGRPRVISPDIVPHRRIG